MPFHRFALVIALLAVCGACTSVSPDVPPGFTTGTPRQTTYYLQWAFEKEYPLHVANCLSRGLMDREGFTPSDLELFWPDVKEWAAENLGDVQQIEIEEIVDIGDEKAEMKLVTYRVGDRLVPVRFIRQTTWEIRHARPSVASVIGRPDGLAEVASYEDDRLVVRLDGIADPELYAPENLEKIILTSAWLVDSVDPVELERFGARPARP